MPAVEHDVPARRHWPEYLIEAAALGTFMISACVFGTLVGHPASPVRQALGTGWMARLVMGVLMGLTAIAIIYSPWGRRSGALMNPALTLVFARLGRIAPRDAAAYVVAQLAGGALGVMVAHAGLGMHLAHPSVRFVVTAPGARGAAAAFVAELVISGLLITMVLNVSASERWKGWTGVFAGMLVATFILFESPLSGMSMNPARSWASALAARDWTAQWIYAAAPLLGMSIAARLHISMRRRAVPCPKLAHAEPCILCEYARSRETAGATGLFTAFDAVSSACPGGSSRRARLQVVERGRARRGRMKRGPFQSTNETPHHRSWW